jgi:two-component sensor histidine kinase
VDLERAVPCGLLINELLTNALKHAFPGGRRGRVAVEMAAGPGGQYDLVVGDDGVGLPAHVDFRRTESLGLQLVCTLARQFEGRIELDPGPGTRFRVTFPLGKDEG